MRIYINKKQNLNGMIYSESNRERIKEIQSDTTVNVDMFFAEHTIKNLDRYKSLNKQRRRFVELFCFYRIGNLKIIK